MTMNCQEFARMIASDDLPEAGLLRRFEARIHLLACPYCRRYAAQLRALGAWARRSWEAEGRDSRRPWELESRILKRCLEELAGTTSSAPDPIANENEGS